MFFIEEPNDFTVSSGLDFLFSCRKDYLSIYHQSNVLIGRYCGNLTYNLAVMVAGNYTVIKFHSEDVKKEKRGFRLHFSELPRSGKCRRDPSVIQEFNCVGNNSQCEHRPFDLPRYVGTVSKMATRGDILRITFVIL